MIHNILLDLVPNAEFVIQGKPNNADEYASQVQWLDARPQPSWADIETARPIVETNKAQAKIEQARRDAYAIEADPLYFGWQRGENTEQEWLDKVAEIRARHPYS